LTRFDLIAIDAESIYFTLSDPDASDTEMDSRNCELDQLWSRSQRNFKVAETFQSSRSARSVVSSTG